MRSRPTHVELISFLAIVLIVRGVHLSILGSIATGMNLIMAEQAKAVLTYGIGHAYLAKPPVAVLILSTVSRVFDLVLGDALPIVVMASHLFLALAFWIWLRRLRLRRGIHQASLLFFLALPLFNSYEGFDNYPTVVAAGMFLLVATTFVDARFGRVNTRSIVMASVFAWCIMLVRIEYILFIPTYVLLETMLSWVLYRALPGKAEIGMFVLVVGFLIVGGLTTMSFRYYDAGDFALAPNVYKCSTFLQGTPDAWVRPEDVTGGDLGRERSGILYFGKPADYDYSLFRMIAENPGKTVAKAVLNVPRWLFQLGRRHVVAPVPITILMILGVLTLIRRRSRADMPRLPAILLATILMTLPLTATSVYAEYMMPAYFAVVVLAASGFVWLLRRLIAFAGRRGYSRRSTRLIGYAAWAGVLVVLELLYFRGGGNLPDATDLRILAERIDEDVAQLGAKCILLDPGWGQVDMFSRTDIRNRWLQYRWLDMQNSLAKCPPSSMPSLIQLALSPVATNAGLRWTVAWGSDVGEPGTCRQRVDAWCDAGYHIHYSRVVRVGHGRTCEIIVLQRND